MLQWFPVTPARVRGSAAAQDWVFAYTFQKPEQSEDGQWRHALVFRSADRTEFGVFEVLGAKLTDKDFERRYDVRRIAARIVDDAKYRRSLVKDSPELRELWNGR